MDILYSLAKTRSAKQFLAVIIDRFPKLTETASPRKVTAHSVAVALCDICILK